jgi:hypothetical protein
MSTDCKAACSKIGSSFSCSVCEEVLGEYEKKSFHQKIYLIASTILMAAIAFFSWMQAYPLLLARDLLAAPFPPAKIATLGAVLLGAALPVIGLALATYNYYTTYSEQQAVCNLAKGRIAMLKGITSFDLSSSGFGRSSGKTPKSV